MAIKPDPTPWALSTNTATEAIATAKSTAEALGYTKVATATEKVEYLLVRVFQNKDPADITNGDVVLLEQRFQEIETEVAKLRAAGSIPKSREFICNMEFRYCMASASKWYEQLTCWMALATCFGSSLTTVISRSD